MKKAKKYIILCIVLLVLAGAAAGGVYAYQAYQEENMQAEVIPVSNINMGWMSDSMTTSGNVMDDYTQAVYLEDKTVSEVKVEEGTAVKIGDPLLVYDTSEAKLQIEMKKLELQGVKNNITLAKREIEKLKKIKPVSNTATGSSGTTGSASGTTKNQTAKTPAKTTTNKKSSTVVVIQVEKKDGDAYNYIDKTAKPYEGKGTVDMPYRFLCTQECYVMGSYLNWLVKEEEVAAFEIWSGNSREEGTLVSCWTVNGAEFASVSENSKWLVATQEQMEDEVVIEEEPESETKNPGTTAPSSESESEAPEENTYTAEELKKEISEKEGELKKLEIEQKKMRLELKGLRKDRGGATVTASINGVVRTVGDPENPPADGSAFIEISGAKGMYVKCYINELMLDQIKVGQEISANNWNTGQDYPAVITEISEYPMDGRMYGEGNPNASYYPFLAYIEEAEGLTSGDYLDVSITPVSTQQEQNSLYIEKAYVREEDGKSYVLKAGEDNRLVKQYVQTGKVVYGSSIEVKSGLLETDRIAFPYGKSAKEGAKAIEAKQ